MWFDSGTGPVEAVRGKLRRVYSTVRHQRCYWAYSLVIICPIASNVRYPISPLFWSTVPVPSLHSFPTNKPAYHTASSSIPVIVQTFCSFPVNTHSPLIFSDKTDSFLHNISTFTIINHAVVSGLFSVAGFGLEWKTVFLTVLGPGVEAGLLFVGAIVIANKVSFLVFSSEFLAIDLTCSVLKPVFAV